jgi:hypothetical protein
VEEQGLKAKYVKGGGMWEVENTKRTTAIGFQMNGLDSICTFEHHPDLSIRYATKNYSPFSCGFKLRV